MGGKGEWEGRESGREGRVGGKGEWEGRESGREGRVEGSGREIVIYFYFRACKFPAGVNISGDLKDPSHSIPQGTLFSLCLTFGIYILMCE